MKTVLQVLAVLACAAMAGCAGSSWDTAPMAAEVKSALTARVQQKGADAVCTDVPLLATSDPNHFTGMAKFSDGSTVGVTVDVDPNTGKWMWKTDS